MHSLHSVSQSSKHRTYHPNKVLWHRAWPKIMPIKIYKITFIFFLLLRLLLRHTFLFTKTLHSAKQPGISLKFIVSLLVIADVAVVVVVVVEKLPYLKTLYVICLHISYWLLGNLPTQLASYLPYNKCSDHPLIPLPLPSAFRFLLVFCFFQALAILNETQFAY